MASDPIDTGPKVLQVERNFVECGVAHTAAGRPYLHFASAGGFPSLRHVRFGIQLKPETTTAEAQQLADLVNQRSMALWALFWDRPLEGPALYEFDENGLAKLR